MGCDHKSDRSKRTLGALPAHYSLVVGLRRFEHRLEHLVEGTFARVFKSGLTPLEIGRRITREIDANRAVGVDGSITVPNHFWVYLSAADHSRFSEVETTLSEELASAAREHIRDEKYRALGPISISFVEADAYPQGAFQVQAQWREGETGPGTGVLRLSDGRRIALAVSPFTVGRMVGSSMELNDVNASRNHAVLTAGPSGWIVTDLSSTNGTFVNGSRIGEHQLRDGDLVVFGSTQATFELT